MFLKSSCGLVANSPICYILAPLSPIWKLPLKILKSCSILFFFLLFLKHCIMYSPKMKPFHHLFIPKTLSIKLLIMVIFYFPICYCNDLLWYNTCGNYFSCVYIQQVGYSFWGGGNRPKRCGHPDLELSCEKGHEVSCTRY